MLKNLNLVKERFLPLPETVESGQEKELNLSDFESLNLLGSGSFATVYEGYWKQNKKKVAIKALTKGLIKKEHNLPQVQRETSLMYKLNHPNIVKLFTHFEDDENIYLVMELATNGNLIERLNKQEKGYFPEKKAVKYITQVVQALKYLHSQNPPIIHRDLKPENILLDKDDNCKLADFGSANQRVLTGTFVGTPLYMAPEMLLKSDYNQTLDIWSLGVLIFELLSGKPPFTVSPTLEKLDAQEALTKNILEMDLEFPRWFPTLAKDLLEKMLNKNPKQRITIGEVESHQWLKSFEANEEDLLEKSRTRSRSLRYGYFAEMKGGKRKKLSEIVEELNKLATETKSHKLLEDLNKNFSNLYEQLNELKVKFEVSNIRYANLSGYYEKIQNQQPDSTDAFLQKIKEYKDLLSKKEELNNIFTQELMEFQKLEEKCCNYELQIIKSQSEYDFCVKDQEKINLLEKKREELIMKKGEILADIEEKTQLIKKQKSEVKVPENSNKQDFLAHFFLKAQYFIREHKKISLLNDKKNSKYMEMKKEQRDLEQSLAKKKEELTKQYFFEFEETKVRLDTDFEREKQFLEEDFYGQKNQLEKKIHKLNIENYTLRTKINITEETYKPRLETLTQLIEKYQENKNTLESIVGQREKKLNELKEILKDNNNDIVKEKKKHHKFAKFLYSSFSSEKKNKEKEKEKEKVKEKEKIRKSNQK